MVFAWIFFRAESFTQAFDVITGILTLRAGEVAWSDLVLVVVLSAVTVAIDLAQRQTGTHTPMLELRPAAQGLLYGVMILAIVLFSGGETVPFIYFQF